MVNKEIYKELTTNFSKEYILEQCAREGDTPFGFILEVIRDNFNLPKINNECWDTAEAVTDFFGFPL